MHLSIIIVQFAVWKAPENVGKLRSRPASFPSPPSLCAANAYDVAVVTSRAGVRRWLKVYPAFQPFPLPEVIWAQAPTARNCSQSMITFEPGK